MNLEHFRLDVTDYIATVTLDRPPVNAQSRATREEFIRLFDALGDRDDVRVVDPDAASATCSRPAPTSRNASISFTSRATTPSTIARCAEFFYAARDCTRPVIAAGQRAGARRRVRARHVLRHRAGV